MTKLQLLEESLLSLQSDIDDLQSDLDSYYPDYPPKFKVMKTIYLDTLPCDADLLTLEQTINREIAIVLSTIPAINVYTSDPAIIDDLEYWLGVAGSKVLEIV